MTTEPILEAINSKLFATTALTAIVGNNIAYARGPIDGTWPQVHYFEVAEVEGYQLDYNSITVQFSAWAHDKYQVLEIKRILSVLFSRFRGTISVTGGTVDINWTELVDSGALPESDPQLFGQQLRYQFRYRGTNIGGF